MVMCTRVANDIDDDGEDDGPAGWPATTGARCCPHITFKSWECRWRDEAPHIKGVRHAARQCSISSIGASPHPRHIMCIYKWCVGPATRSDVTISASVRAFRSQSNHFLTQISPCKRECVRAVCSTQKWDTHTHTHDIGVLLLATAPHSGFDKDECIRGGRNRVRTSR